MKINTGGKQTYKKQKKTLEKVAGPKHGFLHKTKIQWKEYRAGSISEMA